MFRNPWEIDWSDPQQTTQAQRPLIQRPREPTPLEPRYPDQAAQSQNQAAASAYATPQAAANVEHTEAETLNARTQADQNRQQLGIRRANIEAATNRLLDVGALYRNGYQDEALGPLSSIAEWLNLGPLTPGNQSFNAAAQGLTDAALPVVRTPGVGAQSDFEARAFLEANRPRASNSDSTNEAVLDNLQNRLNEQRRSIGLPEVDWRAPQPEPPGLGAPQPGERMDRSNRPAINPDRGGTQLSRDNTQAVEDPVLRGVAGHISQMLARGASRGQIVQYLRGAGLDPARDPVLNRSINQAIQYRATPDYARWRRTHPRDGFPVDPSFYTRNVPLNPLAARLNDVSQSSPAAYAMAAGQAVTGNRLDDLVGLAGGNAEQARAGMESVRQENPLPSLAGDISGTMLAYGGANGALRQTVGRLAPALPGAASALASPLGTAARHVAGDLTYGAYAGAGNGDALGGAFTTSLGGAAGRTIPGALGATVRGVANPAIDYLAARGVPTTLGGIVGQNGRTGQVIRGLENRLAGIPVVGDFISNQQRRGIAGLNRAAHQETLDPIGGTASAQIGEEAADHTLNQINQAFANATRGVRLAPDAAFNRAHRGWARSAARPAMTGDVREVVNAAIGQVDELFNGARGGSLSGENLHNAFRVIDEARAAVAQMPSGQAGTQTLRDMERSLLGLARRQAPNVIPALNRARAAYRRFAIVRDATRAAVNDEQGMFTPAQLGIAMRNNVTRYGGRNQSASTNRPFYELHNAARQVLPNRVPDSGTAGRALVAGGLLTAGGEASDLLGFTDSGARNAALLAAPLMLPYTNAGRAAAEAILSRRPQAARDAGQYVIDNPIIRRLLGMTGAGIGENYSNPGY